MSSFPPPVTIITVILFIMVGAIWKLPLPARLGLVVVAGLIIYFGMGGAYFAFPYGDDMEISGLYGGRMDPSAPLFSPLTMGFICLVLGVLSSLVTAGIHKLVGKKD